MRYLRSLFGILGRIPQTCFQVWEGLWGWLSLRFRTQTRVCKDLRDLTEEGTSLLEGAYRWLNYAVLAWDYDVRSVLRRHLTDDHLARYAKATGLEPNDQEDVPASMAALRRGLDEIGASIQAVQRKRVIPRGGLFDMWWFRALLTSLMPSGVVVVGLIVVLTNIVTGGGDPNKIETSNTTSGITQNIVEDPGKVVQVPTPAPAETPPPGATPTPTPDLPVSGEPVINIPPEPEEDQPIDTSEIHFVNGVAALQVGNFQLAVEKFDAAIQAEPGFVRAYYNLAIAYDNIGTEEANQAAVENYTAAIELWNSLDSDGDGLLLETKLGRGLLLVNFFTDERAVCLGKSDLLEYLERGDVSQRNLDAVNKALAGIVVDCQAVTEIS